MKRFRSKVTTLLGLRQQQEEKKLEAYGRALSLRQAAMDRLQAIERACDALRAEIRNAMSVGCSAAVLAQFQGYGTRLEADRLAQTGVVQQAEGSVSKALSEVLNARRERESVEKFQTRERALFDQDVLREEQKVLDELALRRLMPSWAEQVAA
jgi:flagellar protein FliJ